MKINSIEIQFHGTFKHKMTLMHSNISLVTRHFFSSNTYINLGNMFKSNYKN